MAVVTKEMQYRVYFPDGVRIDHARLTARLREWDKSGADIFTGEVSVDVPVSGLGIIALQVSDGLDWSGFYDVHLTYWSVGREAAVTQYLGVASPTVGGPVNLAAILTPPTTSPDYGQFLIDARNEALAAAVAAALSAEVATDTVAAVNFATDLVQEKVNELYLGMDGAQIFTNAQNASQGVAFAKVGAQKKVFVLQRVDSTSGDWSATEQHRIVEFNMTGDGSELAHVSYTVPLSLGHQMISARVEGGQVYIYGSTPVAAPFTGADAGKGVVKFPWNGADTDQADFVHYQLLGLAGSGHRFESYKKSHTFVDDDYIMLVTNDTTDDPAIDGDLETGDSRVIIWDRAEVEAAADPLEVEPVATWQRIKPRQIQNHYTQGAVISNGHVWVQCGYYAPLQQQMIQIWTLNGELVREFSMDGARGDYDFDQLRGVGALGIPASFEPEGLTVDDNGNVITLHMANFRAAGSVVSRGSKTYAAYRTTTAGIPCTNLLYWTPVNLTPSGAWDAATAYAPGAYIQRKKVLHVIKPPAGGAREKPLNTGRTLADSAAFLQLPNAAVDVTWPWGEALSFGTFAMTADEIRELVSFRGGNAIRLRDINEGADITNYFQIKNEGFRDGIPRNFTEMRSSGGELAYGAGINLYGHDDPVQPFSAYLFAGAPEGEFDAYFRIGRTSAELNVPLTGDAVRGTYGVARAHQVRVHAELPLNFPDIASAPALNPGGYWYPQGAAYDAAGWLLISYSGINQVGPTLYNLIVVYDENMTYQGWFRVSEGAETPLVSGSFDGADLVIDKPGPGSSFVRHVIGAKPVNGADESAHTVLIASGCGLQCAREGALTMVEQSDVDFGLALSRTKFNLYDADFVLLSSIYLPINVMGYMTSDYPLYPYVPKSQGIAMRGGRIYVNTGGSYIPATDGLVSPTVADVGIATMALDGSLIDYGVMRADRFLDYLTGDGYDAVRTEAEGCFFAPNGELHSLFISSRPSSPDATTTGVLILSHFDAAGVDHSGIRSNYAPFNMRRLTDGMLPRTNGTEFRHPLTGVVVSDMSDLLDMMAQMQLPRAAWFTASMTMTPLPGMVLPADNYAVEIHNLNNGSFRVWLRRTSANPRESAEYHVYDSDGTWIATAADTGLVRVIEEGAGFIKYSDGRMECFGSTSSFPATSEANGNIFRSTPSTAVTFDEEFIADPEVYLTSVYVSGGLAIGISCVSGPSTSGFTARAFSGASNSVVSAKWRAFGRWAV